LGRKTIFLYEQIRPSVACGRVRGKSWCLVLVTDIGVTDIGVTDIGHSRLAAAFNPAPPFYATKISDHESSSPLLRK
jgi:hypothetical protein